MKSLVSLLTILQLGRSYRLAFAIGLTAFFTCSNARAAELTVFAAASLSDALQTLAPAYRAATGDTLRFCFGASGTLARQIKAGAPADVFISADETRLNQLDSAGLIVPNSRRTLLANTLVLVVATDEAPLTSLADLSRSSIKRLALGDPATVPAGTYAKDLLLKRHLWDTAQPKAVFLDNVRAVLAAVEAGNADAGFVYKTDALIAPKLKIALEIPPHEGPAITYPAAVITGSQAARPAQKFVVWLTTAEAQTIFANYGFLPAPPHSDFD